MYAFGAYIRIHGLNGRYNRIKFWNKVIAGTLILLVVVPAGNIAISGRIGGSLNDLLAAILAISLFARLVLQPPFTSLFVNRMAQSVLGVYLIHDNSFVRHFLWCDWLPNASYLHTNMMVPVFVAKVLMIFIVCMLIDQIRLFIIEKPVSLWLNNHWKWMRNKFIFITGRIKNELS